MYINKNKNKDEMSGLRLSDEVKKELSELYEHYDQKYESDSDDDDDIGPMVWADQSIYLNVYFRDYTETINVKYNTESGKFEVKGLNGFRLSLSFDNIQGVISGLDKYFTDARVQWKNR
jgi:hypothetical protein